jgi:alpha-galactosidase
MKKIFFVLLAFVISSFSMKAQTIWLDKLDLSSMTSGWGTPHANKSVMGKTLSIAGQTFDRGVGTRELEHVQ